MPLVEGNTAFALDLYAKIRTTAGDENIVFSPYSISMALAMTYAGARNETARQMEQTLHFDKILGGTHALFRELDTALKGASGTNELNIANSLWPQKGFPFKSQFLDIAKTNYGATIKAVDYFRERKKPAAEINKWVDGKTRHKITDIVTPGVLDEGTRLVLVNAIYFNGLWTVPFEKFSTLRDSFFCQPGKVVSVSFMSRQAKDILYGENNLLQTLVLPYKGGRLQMVVLLPRKLDGIEELEKDLNSDSLAVWMAQAGHSSVRAILPKFKMTADLSLNSALQDLGMKDAFDSMADFSGMARREDSLRISQVFHKAYIEVNEKGTEAAAATAVVVGMATYLLENPRVFLANHPFLFLIRESSTGTILFMGRVMEPKND